MVVLLSTQLATNSANSSKPPSQDPNRERKVKNTKGQKRKPGGQNGHKGSYLKPVENPTESEEILVDRNTLPPGKYRTVGFESRQVFDIEVSLHVKEYRGEYCRK